MRILFISGELTGSALCQRLVQEGNEVRLYIHKVDWATCYDNMVEKVTDWRGQLEWVRDGGIIVFDDVIFGKEQEELRQQGYTVIGGSKDGDLLELDRKLFQKISEAHGLQTLPSYNFEKAQDAIDFVTEHDTQRWVVKQSSHLSYLNHISNSNSQEDVIRVLKRYEKRNIIPIHLQKYIEGVEVGVARYFNGTDWVGPIEINHEHKRLSEGDKGPLTPEMGTVLWYTSDETTPLFTETLAKLKPYLQEIDFRGDFDINFIVNEEGIWPLEATPRFGAPSTQVHVELHKSPWSDFLSAVGRNESFNLEFKEGYGVVVSIVVAPFPYEPDQIIIRSDKLRITFDTSLSSEDFDHIHFEEVAKDDTGYYWAGNYGLVLHVTAQEKTITEARKKVYERVKKIHIPGMYYRTDIGARVEGNDIPKLKEWGWVN